MTDSMKSSSQDTEATGPLLKECQAMATRVEVCNVCPMCLLHQPLRLCNLELLEKGLAANAGISGFTKLE